MIFNIMTILVFIAELIIAYSLCKNILKLDKKILEINDELTSLKPEIKDVGYLIKKISSQLIEFAYDFVSKIYSKRDTAIIHQLNKFVITIILLKLNSKFIKKFLRSKPFKLLTKGFSLLKYVV